MLLEQRNHSSTAKKLLIGSNYMTQYRTWSRSKVQTPKVFPFPSRKDPLKKNKKYVQEMSKKLSIKQYLLLGGTRIQKRDDPLRWVELCIKNSNYESLSLQIIIKEYPRKKKKTKPRNDDQIRWRKVIVMITNLHQKKKSSRLALPTPSPLH